MSDRQHDPSRQYDPSRQHDPNLDPAWGDRRTHIDRINPGDNPAAIPGQGPQAAHRPGMTPPGMLPLPPRQETTMDANSLRTQALASAIQIGGSGDQIVANAHAFYEFLGGNYVGPGGNLVSSSYPGATGNYVDASGNPVRAPNPNDARRDAAGNVVSGGYPAQLGSYGPTDPAGNPRSTGATRDAAGNVVSGGYTAQSGNYVGPGGSTVSTGTQVDAAGNVVSGGSSTSTSA